MLSLFSTARSRVSTITTTTATATATATTTSLVEPTSLDEVCHALRKNKLVELKLGWKDCHYIVTLRSLRTLERALAKNKSLQAVSLGWRNELKYLPGLLKAMAKHCNLTKLKIELNHDLWIPEQVLKQLLNSQMQLVEIELQAVHVGRRYSSSSHRGGGNNNDAQAHADASSVIPLIARLHRQEHLKSIQLLDCRMTDDMAVRLADFLHVRGGIAKLSVRGNNQRSLLGPRGLRVLCQAPVMEQLDLSLCDLDSNDAQAVAMGIANRPWPLQELLICGNYRMDAVGLTALTSQACCDKLVALNISYCDIGHDQALQIFESLQLLLPDTTLRQIVMQGSQVSDAKVSQALSRLLGQNNSLRVVRLNDPTDPQNLKVTDLLVILAGLQKNYQVEELSVDSIRTTQEVAVRRDMDFMLRLNRAGRRILRPAPLPLRISFPLMPTLLRKTNNKRPAGSTHRILDEEWLQVLERAGQDLDVVYWIVRESAGRFDRYAESTQKAMLETHKREVSKMNASDIQ